MAIFKCKMCGGTLEINGNETVATCEYCGTRQTLPRLDDERRVNLYDRANHFRRNNEYDKAANIYEQILNEDNIDAEAYWSLVLCKYGIEYVEDPSSHKRIPTVNRAQFTSIFDDDNYKSAIKYADSYQKIIYENEAKAINEIQKGILSISSKEDPFDVFICYKETDNNGRRTIDSVLANDLYHQLTQEGFKVFFSRITLEDKLGTAYEPYIFAALNSAKVMVVLGTKPEYFNAVWVKNEWSRYLTLVKQSNGKKILIPAYKDMDPYDLPEEFSHLQAQDMSKLGFMQDLIRGIKKITQVEEAKVTTVRETVISSNASTEPLLKRAFMFLEDKDWYSANEYCEKVLDIDPENAMAYLGKMMVELHVSNVKSLKDQAKPFDDNINYQKTIRFADEKLKSTLIDYIDYINTRNENTRIKGIYDNAKNAMSEANTENEYKIAAHLFETINEYLDSAILAHTCYEKAEIVRKNTILSKGKGKMIGDDISNYELAINLFESISGWKDADDNINICQQKIKEIKVKKEEEAVRIAKRNKKIAIIATPIVCIVIVIAIVLNTVIIPNNKYNNAITMVNDGNIVDAYETFISLDGYKDSIERANSIYDKYKIKKLKVSKQGDYVKFGKYEQDGDLSNGAEEIEWLVIDEDNGKILLISKYVLDNKPFFQNSNDIPLCGDWEESTLRKWLNNDFLYSTFSDDEQKLISSTYSSRREIWDRVFILEDNEVKDYFDSNSARQSSATEYANSQGVDDGSHCTWLTMTSYSRYGKCFPAYVDRYGNVNANVEEISNKSPAGIRPVLWINTNAIE